MSNSSPRIPIGTNSGLGGPARSPGRKTPQARIKPLDLAIMGAFAALSLALSTIAPRGLALVHPSPYLAALLAVAAYLLGFVARDRTTAIVAGALVACSLSVSRGAPADLVFDLLTMFALVGAVAQVPLVAVILAALATSVSADGLLLGIVVLAILMLDPSPRRMPALALYVAVAVAGWSANHVFLHRPIHFPSFEPTSLLLVHFFLGVSGIVGWLAFPLFADLAEPAKRARWKPVAGWTFLYLIVASLVHLDAGDRKTILEPFLAIVAAGGFARLLPVIASDFMPTNARYLLATAAVATLALSRVFASWPASVRPAAVPVTASIASHPAGAPPRPTSRSASAPEQVKTNPAAPATTKAPSKPIPPPATTPQVDHTNPPPLPHHVIILNSSQVKPPAASPAPAPASSQAPPPVAGTAPQPDLGAEAERYEVPLTHKLPNGQVVFRTKWAVLWEIKERKAAEAAKMAAPKPPASPAAPGGKP